MEIWFGNMGISPTIYTYMYIEICVYIEEFHKILNIFKQHERLDYENLMDIKHAFGINIDSIKVIN